MQHMIFMRHIRIEVFQEYQLGNGAILWDILL